MNAVPYDSSEEVLPEPRRLDHGLEELVGVVCSVCNHILTLHTSYELVGLSHIVLLSSSPT